MTQPEDTTMSSRLKLVSDFSFFTAPEDELTSGTWGNCSIVFNSTTGEALIWLNFPTYQRPLLVKLLADLIAKLIDGS